MITTPELPITVNKDIQNAYVEINDRDVVYTNFESSKLKTFTTADTMYSIVFTTTASTTGSNSAYYNSTRQMLYNFKLENSFTALTGDIGILTLKKRYFDCKIKPGTLTATVTGDHADDYYDSGSGEFKRKAGGNITVGAFMEDLGMAVVTSTSSSLTSIVQSVTSIRYQAVVEHTELSVFCKCKPNELNFSLNPSSLNLTTLNYSYTTDPLTSSTCASEFSPMLVSSGINWQPHITSVGLYNDSNELLAIAKLSRPLKKSTDLPMTIRLQIDL